MQVDVVKLLSAHTYRLLFCLYGLLSTGHCCSFSCFIENSGPKLWMCFIVFSRRH